MELGTIIFIGETLGRKEMKSYREVLVTKIP